MHTVDLALLPGILHGPLGTEHSWLGPRTQGQRAELVPGRHRSRMQQARLRQQHPRRSLSTTRCDPQRRVQVCGSILRCIRPRLPGRVLCCTCVVGDMHRVTFAEVALSQLAAMSKRPKRRFHLLPLVSLGHTRHWSGLTPSSDCGGVGPVVLGDRIRCQELNPCHTCAKQAACPLDCLSSAK